MRDEKRGLWDWIVDRSENHPVAFRRFTALIFTVILSYGILGWLASYQAEKGRDGCEQDNAVRLSELRESSAMMAKAEILHALWIERGDPALAHVYEELADTQQGQIEQLVKIAEVSGHQNAPDAVTVSCANAWPKPIPWFEEGD